MTTDAKRKANKKYEGSKLDHIHLRVPKGDKAKIESHAVSRSETVNGFIKRAIQETIDRDNATL